MKKDLLIALVVVLVSLTAAGAFLLSRSGGDAGNNGDFDPLAPPRMPVLAGRAPGLEVLVKPWMARDDAAFFRMQQLVRELGLDPGAHTFIQVLILNAGDEPLRLDPADLQLTGSRGEAVEVQGLRELVEVTRKRLPLLAVHAPDPGVLLEPGRLRTSLVAVPRAYGMAAFTRGRLGGVDLARFQAPTERMNAYLARPRRPLLAAVLGEDEDLENER